MLGAELLISGRDLTKLDCKSSRLAEVRSSDVTEVYQVFRELLMARPSKERQAWVHELLETLQEDYHDFNASVVPLLSYPTAVEFCKQVSKGKPCLYQVPTTSDFSWPALSWTMDVLTSKVQEPVEVAATPDGNADSLISHPRSADELLFVEPASIYLTMKQLLSRLAPTSTHHSKIAFYLQSQNSNLTSTSLSPLLKDLPTRFDFAEEVLGQPDARNIWIGDERSVTSVHRDPYENLYLVLKGQKIFRLWAPVDEVSMPTTLVSTGRYQYNEVDGEPRFDLHVNDDDAQIPWVNFDPLSPLDGHQSANQSGIPGRMVQVTVKEGQILYLPAGWYHHVSQTCGMWDDGSQAPCIAVNYWYDQEYEGDRYVLRQFLSKMVATATESPP